MKASKLLLECVQGSVSVMLIWIISFIFLFTSVLIDYARMISAQWRAEVLAQVGIRSVMSAYEPILQQKYQLFAYGKTEPARIIEKVMREQAKLKGNGVFSWIPLQLSNHTTAITRPLGKFAELDKQIFEAMKYQAPLQFTWELVNKFKSIAGVMKEATQTTELLSQLQQLVHKRDQEIDKALALQKKIRDKAIAANIKQLIATSAGDVMRTNSLGVIKYISDIAAQYEDYMDKINTDKFIIHEDKSYKNATNYYEAHSRLLSHNLVSILLQQQQHHQVALAKIYVHLEKSAGYNTDMKQVIQDIRTSTDYTSYHRIAGQPTKQLGDKSMVNAMTRIRQSADKLVLADSFFTTWKQELEQQYTMIAYVQEKSKTVQAIVSQMRSHSIEPAVVKQASANVWHAWGKYEIHFVNQANMIMRREYKINQYRLTEKQQKEKEKQANMKLGRAANLLTNFSNIDSGGGEQYSLFQRVKEKEQSILKFNEMIFRQPFQQVKWERDSVVTSQQAIKYITALYNHLADSIHILQERMYRIEYAYSYFTTFHPKQLRSIFTSGQTMNRSLSNFHIHNQEMEYILYGFASPVRNLVAAYRDIFMMRVAIRIMEGLVENSRLGNPLLILAAALVYSIEQALQDIILLVTHDQIPLSRYLPSVKLSYADHLRLFMLIHSKRETMLGRMLALIDLNTNIDPTTCGTYGETELRVSTPLWFLSGIMKLLGQTGIWDGDIADGRYYITKTSVFSY